MAKTGNEVVVPLTNTGRKYEYITWRKEQDEDLRSILGKKTTVNLQIGDVLQKAKRIDLKRRQIGITYRLTRGLPAKVKRIRLNRVRQNKIAVYFE